MPSVSCLILARPTRSEMLFIQIVGRGLRTCVGKDDCIILDHSNTGIDLGRPDEIFYDDFVTGAKQKEIKEAKKKDKKKTKDRVCSQCQTLLRNGSRVCHACGHMMAPRDSEIYVADGELTELGKNGSIGKASYDDKQSFYSGLKWIAEDRKYSSGWVAHTYKKRFGVWPRGMTEIKSYPSQSILNFVRSKNIAWSKANK